VFKWGIQKLVYVALGIFEIYFCDKKNDF